MDPSVSIGAGTLRGQTSRHWLSMMKEANFSMMSHHEAKFARHFN
jgi:hypothetical protein